MKKVTLKDIANELNVTVGTVSHALNGIDDISEQMKQKVLKTAKKMGYISNASAVSLRSGKTNTIAVIVPDISNPHIAYQIKLIEDKMKEHNCSVIILNTNEDEETEYQAIKTACSKQVDGILLCPCQKTKDNIEFLEKIEVPYALIGRYFSEINNDYVCADDFAGGYIAGKYLLDNGCKNPSYVGAYKYIESSINRFEGLKKAFFEQGINIENDNFIEISPKAENMYGIVEQIFNQNKNCDSIVAFSDIIAFEIMSEVKNKNILVIGFDAINSHLYMPFHSISVGMEKGGWADKASEIILKKINGESEKVQELIPVKIFEFN